MRILPFFPFLPLVVACGSDIPTGSSNTPPPPTGGPVAAATIQVQDNFYSPSTVLISAGGTVTWTWAGVDAHSVTSDGAPSFTGVALRNGPFTLGPVVFAVAGTYSFHCTAHGVAGTYGGGTMTGAVFVQ